jgi:ribosomal protein L12E/L44/L45/RPP1/RPP2
VIITQTHYICRVKKSTDMETILIELKHHRAIALLKELEELNILKILKQTKIPKTTKPQSLAERFGGKLDAVSAASFQQQLNESRQEWERTS